MQGGYKRYMHDTRDKVRWSEKDENGVTRKEKLLRRQWILEIVRAYFRENHFFEAEIPLLVSGTTPDFAIQSFEIKDKYLTTSTEYHIKRMIAGGFEKVFTLTKNFREYEFDSCHNPEFTMLEWARSQVSLEAIEQDVIHLVSILGKALGSESDYLAYQGSRIYLKKEHWQEITFQDLFYTHYGIVIPEDYDASETLSLVKKAGLGVDDFFQHNSALLLSDLLDKAIKKIGFDSPVLLKKWPSLMTSSAECGSINEKWTARTELIIAGIEIADGFPFLCNYEMHKFFFERSAALRKDTNLPPVKYDEKYLVMLQQGLCTGAGMALGIDRLCMLFTNTTNIRDVLCFAWDEL